MLGNFALLASDSRERAELEALSRGEGGFAALREEYLTTADVLAQYKSVKLELPYMLDFVPAIKPRAYSIASAPRMTPDELQLCVLVDTWATKAGVRRFGLTCDMLLHAKAGARLAGKIRGSSMQVPTDDRTPLVMASIGSGIAPHMSLIRDRAAKRAAGADVGPMTLFFGNRSAATEFLYEAELKAYAREGLLTLHTAFSREKGKPKEYVQDKMRTEEAQEALVDALLTNKGYLYVCGNRQLPPAVQRSVRDAFALVLPTNNHVEQEIVRMYKSGRINEESW